MPLTPTDFSSGGGIAGNPLTFQKFDTLDDTRVLDSVTLTVHALIKNEFGMKFYTPATITTSVATGNASQPGPSITLFQPDGKSPLLTAAAANDPAVLSRSVTWGSKPGETLPQEFSSKFDPSSPYYIAPAISEKTQTLKLTNPADLAIFTGPGSLALPVSGSAWARITSSSGNGYGDISTKGTADVTVTYNSPDRGPAPQTVPEPAALVLWGLGGAAFAIRYRSRYRRAG
ncbi:MAG: choice-of-anchor E domain-containing protein [Isosphaeraceae bacterium]